jgi:metal-responsive CopG/Arc/MetJ family transcriptional regulator
MQKNTKIGISIPKEMLADIDFFRKISNRSKFIVGLIRKPLQSLKENDSS